MYLPNAYMFTLLSSYASDYFAHVARISPGYNIQFIGCLLKCIPCYLKILRRLNKLLSKTPQKNYKKLILKVIIAKMIKTYGYFLNLIVIEEVVAVEFPHAILKYPPSEPLEGF